MRFSHAIAELEERLDFYKRKKTIADKYGGVDAEYSKECQEKIEDIEDALQKLNNHSLTDRI